MSAEGRNDQLVDDFKIRIIDQFTEEGVLLGVLTVGPGPEFLNGRLRNGDEDASEQGTRIRCEKVGFTVNELAHVFSVFLMIVYNVGPGMFQSVFYIGDSEAMGGVTVQRPQSEPARAALRSAARFACGPLGRGQADSMLDRAEKAEPPPKSSRAS